MNNVEKRSHVLWSEGNDLTPDLKAYYYALLETGIKQDRLAVQITCTDEEFDLLIRAVAKRFNNHHCQFVASEDVMTAKVCIHCADEENNREIIL